MSFVKEFKEFALKGNLIDMAIGVVIGTAFGKVVSAFIDGLVMPPIGKLMGNVDFNNLYFGLNDAIRQAQVVNPALSIEEAKKIGPVIAWGSFMTVAIDFLIIAFVVFMVMKAMNATRKKEAALPAAPPAPSTEEKLLMEIRDLLKK